MTEHRPSNERPTVFLVDDDPAVRASLSLSLASAGYHVESYESAESYLEHHDAARYGCVVLDVRMPSMDGLDLQAVLNERAGELPIVFISGHADVPVAVRALKAGAANFLEKPFSKQDLLNSIRDALEQGERRRGEATKRDRARRRCARLTGRERQVMKLLVEGRTNKEIARRLDVSPRTVEQHRARVMEKMETRSVAELVGLAALCDDRGRPHAPSRGTQQSPLAG